MTDVVQAFVDKAEQYERVKARVDRLEHERGLLARIAKRALNIAPEGHTRDDLVAALNAIIAPAASNPEPRSLSVQLAADMLPADVAATVELLLGQDREPIRPGDTLTVYSDSLDVARQARDEIEARTPYVTVLLDRPVRAVTP